MAVFAPNDCFVRNGQRKTERKFQKRSNCTGCLLRKCEVCATLLFDLKHGWQYNVSIELVGKIGEEEGIFQQIPFLFFGFACGFAAHRCLPGRRKEKEEQT
jgi:hypothetical protein